MFVLREVIAEIQDLARDGKYRVRSHAVRHMVEEGFDENQLIQISTSKLQLLEEYSGEDRYLVVGRFSFTSNAISPLHITCDLSNAEVLDIVTAYIPQRPWWSTPPWRGEKMKKICTRRVQIVAEKLKIALSSKSLSVKECRLKWRVFKHSSLKTAGKFILRPVGLKQL